MEPRKIVLYIAMSVDGYIATKDHDLTFLSAVETPDEDYGYNKFIRTVDTVIMGRKTYDKVLSFGIEFPHRGRKCYVLSRKRTGADENVEFFNGDIGDLIASIRKTGGLDLFVDGGSEVVGELMKRSLIDRYIISIIPIILGGGIPLFTTGVPALPLKCTQSLSFPSGLVQLWYERAE